VGQNSEGQEQAVDLAAWIRKWYCFGSRRRRQPATAAAVNAFGGSGGSVWQAAGPAFGVSPVFCYLPNPLMTGTAKSHRLALSNGGFPIRCTRSSTSETRNGHTSKMLHYHSISCMNEIVMFRASVHSLSLTNVFVPTRAIGLSARLPTVVPMPTHRRSAVRGLANPQPPAKLRRASSGSPATSGCIWTQHPLSCRRGVCSWSATATTNKASAVWDFGQPQPQTPAGGRHWERSGQPRRIKISASREFVRCVRSAGSAQQQSLVRFGASRRKNQQNKGFWCVR